LSTRGDRRGFAADRSGLGPTRWHTGDVFGRLCVVVCLLGLLSSCGGDDDDAPVPVVELIPEAVAAVEEHYGAPQEYFEISARIDGVAYVAAVDDATVAEQGSYMADGVFGPPEPIGEASGATFRADQIDVDPDRIFAGIRDELDDPVIIDFAIRGGPDGTVIYDATVVSDGGGLLRVTLGPEGQIQAVTAQ